MWTVLSLVTDISLGAMAYHLAWKLSKVQEVQTQILAGLVPRVERLEIRVFSTQTQNEKTSLGFTPAGQEI